MQIVYDSEATVSGLFIAVKRRDETQECSVLSFYLDEVERVRPAVLSRSDGADSSFVIENRVST